MQEQKKFISIIIQKMIKKLAIVILLFPVLVFSQKAPKVGLVLSGGGAKGFAHISVLKEIEKAGIQLDYIGGTSMGAIVGGLYAAGYSANQIEKIIGNTDFVQLLSDATPREALPFFEKENGEKHAVTLPVNNASVGLPTAVSKGQGVLNLLLKLTQPVSEITNFSKLPIPFFCIATDVETGGQVVLEKGSLALAMRASGSFPTLLIPVEYDNKLLIDGGIANNFPSDIMKSKGVDIIIGSDVQGKLFHKDKLTSVVSILNQIVSYKMYEKSDKGKESVQVYIHPKIYDYSVVDFAKKNEILEVGAVEAKKFEKVFKEIAKKQHSKAKKTQLTFYDTPFRLKDIKIENYKNFTRSYVLGALKLKTGDEINYEELVKRVGYLSATDNYSKIEFKTYDDIDNADEKSLVVKVKENKQHASLSLGIHYDLIYKSGLIATYSKKNVLSENDIVSFDAILGDNLRYNLNYFIDNGFNWGFGFTSRYNHFRTNTFFNSPDDPSPLNTAVNKINLSFTDFTHRVFGQTTFNRKFAIGFGAELKEIKATTETIITNNEETVFDDSNYFNLFTFIKLDTYDKPNFMTKGFYVDASLTWYLRSSDFSQNFKDYPQAKVTFGFATLFTEKLLFNLTSQAGFSFKNPISTIFDFRLGGYNKNYVNSFIPFYGYDFGELSESTFLRSEFNFKYNFLDNHYLVFIANYARLNNNVLRDIEIFDDIKSGYALGYSLDSFIGPIELKYTWTPDNTRKYWLLNIGYWF